MNFSNFFIDRPIFAGVLSVVILLGGGIAYTALPVAQYPEVAPPTVIVRATFPGATPEVIADTVATPIEQQVNGVEGMLYMESQSANDGSMSLTVTFELGTDLDIAQVQVQNRVAAAESGLPEVVRRIGVVTSKESANLLLVVHMLSPDGSLEPIGHRELRAAKRPRSAQPDQGGRQRADLRRRRLFHADLVGRRQAGRARA